MEIKKDRELLSSPMTKYYLLLYSFCLCTVTYENTDALVCIAVIDSKEKPPRHSCYWISASQVTYMGFSNDHTALPNSCFNFTICLFLSVVSAISCYFIPFFQFVKNTYVINYYFPYWLTSTYFILIRYYYLVGAYCLCTLILLPRLWLKRLNQIHWWILAQLICESNI